MYKKLSKVIYAVLIAVICNMLWGTAFPVVKLIYKEAGILPGSVKSPVIIAGIRFLLASIIIFLLYKYIFKGKFIIPKGKTLLTILLIGLLQTFCQYVFYFIGLVNVPGSKASIILSVEVFFAFIFAHYMFNDDRFNKGKIIGLILGILGVIIVNIDSRGLSFDFTLMGEGFLLLAACSNALAYIVIKKYTNNLNAVYLTGWQMFLGALMLLIFSLFRVEKVHINISSFGIVLLIYSSILSAVAFSLWNTLLKKHNVSQISISKFLTPVFGSLFSIMFLPEELFNFKLLLSLVLVSLGIYSIYYRRKSIKSNKEKAQ